MAQADSALTKAEISRILSYPFDSQYILKKRRALKKALLADGRERTPKKIAVLGGSTTNDIADIMELFLLENGILPSFYQSEYAKYWEDAMFGNPDLAEFSPDIIFVHTTFRNLLPFLPTMRETAGEAESKLEKAKSHFADMWDRLSEAFHCPIIQNNFEYPFFRLLGNRDATDIHGAVAFVNSINAFLGQSAREKESLYINDLNYVSACYGLDRWCDLSYWYMYKYAMALDAVPYFAHSVCAVIKSIFGHALGRSSRGRRCERA